jgi:hypothetical protein
MDGDHMLEAMAADAVTGEMKLAAGHSLPAGTPCPNCKTPLAGPWCHACGQRAEKFDRSIWALIAEAFEGLTHVDGRVWRTLGRLIAKPGQLTRDYLEGHRAPQIPPFRLFLVVLLLVFFAGTWNFQANHVHFKFAPQDSFIAKDPQDRTAFGEAASAMRAKGAFNAWVVERIEAANKDPEAIFEGMEKWGHQFAILLLPIAAVLLSVLFAFRKGVYVFDHLIFSMHSLSFQGLLLSVVFIGGIVTPWAGLLLLLAPAHLFVHMRRTYGIGAIGTLIRMALLFIGSAYGFGVLMLGLMLVGLASVK